MVLTARNSSPLSLYRKLEREAYRAFHAKTPLHKADHFFNFCVTAASMRDYTLEHLNLVSSLQKQPYHDFWAAQPAIVAATEIANLSKHFVLRDRGTRLIKQAKTRTVRMKRAAFVALYVNSAGDMKALRSERAEVSVTLSDGKVLELYAFVNEILTFWKSSLESLGFRVRRQSFPQLTGK